MDLFEEIQRQKELMGVNDLSALKKFISDVYHLDGVIEPNTVPLNNGYIRLYHQLENYI
jgi:hypothetical protein